MILWKNSERVLRWKWFNWRSILKCPISIPCHALELVKSLPFWYPGNLEKVSLSGETIPYGSPWEGGGGINHPFPLWEQHCEWFSFKVLRSESNSFIHWISLGLYTRRLDVYDSTRCQQQVVTLRVCASRWTDVCGGIGLQRMQQRKMAPLLKITIFLVICSIFVECR